LDRKKERKKTACKNVTKDESKCPEFFVKKSVHANEQVDQTRMPGRAIDIYAPELINEERGEIS